MNRIFRMILSIFLRKKSKKKNNGFQPESDLSPKERAFALRLHELKSKSVQIWTAGNKISETVTIFAVETNGLYMCCLKDLKGDTLKDKFFERHVHDILTIQVIV